MNHRPKVTLREHACATLAEADLADRRAETLAAAALKVAIKGDPHRAEAMWATCRRIRVQALLDRGRSAAAEARASEAGRR